MSLIILLLLTTTGCVSKPKAEYVLPPEPRRAERQPVTNLADAAKLISYYEGLLQEWEKWGEDVKKIIGEESVSVR